MSRKRAFRNVNRTAVTRKNHYHGNLSTQAKRLTTHQQPRWEDICFWSSSHFFWTAVLPHTFTFGYNSGRTSRGHTRRRPHGCCKFPPAAFSLRRITNKKCLCNNNSKLFLRAGRVVRVPHLRRERSGGHPGDEPRVAGGRAGERRGAEPEVRPQPAPQHRREGFGHGGTRPAVTPAGTPRGEQ